MKLITIIIPMFNEEDNIKKCISTLKNQTNQSFDVIFIDDGSTDHTLINLEREMRSYQQINYRVITQTNKGAAAARKIGVVSSETKYVMFYDCDDLLSDNMIDAFYENYNKYNDPDIIIPKMSIQNKDSSWTELEFFSNEKILNPLNCIRYSLDGWKIHGCFAMKKEIFLNSYKDYSLFNHSNENFINNDEVITRLIFNNSKVIVTSDAIYYYCYNSSSTTKRINENGYLKIKNSIILEKIFENNPYLNRYTKAEFISTLWGLYRYRNKHRKMLSNLEQWNQIINQSLRSIKYQDTLHQLPLKQKIQISLLKLQSGLNLL